MKALGKEKAKKFSKIFTTLKKTLNPKKKTLNLCLTPFSKKRRFQETS
jgi:hypothetical protein